MGVAPHGAVVDTRGRMSEGSVGAGLKLGDAELAVRLAPVKDFALAIGADDVVTPREYTFLRQKVGELIPIDEGESIDVLTRHAIRLYAPQAKPEALATLGLRLTKLKPSDPAPPTHPGLPRPVLAIWSVLSTAV